MLLINLNNKSCRDEYLNSILNAAAVRAAQDELRGDRVAVGFSNVEGNGICVGVVNNNAIPGVVNAGAAIANYSISATHAVRTGSGENKCTRGRPKVNYLWVNS